MAPNRLSTAAVKVSKPDQGFNDIDAHNDTLDLSTHQNRKDGEIDIKKNIDTSMMRKLSDGDNQSIASEVWDNDNANQSVNNDEFPR